MTIMEVRQQYLNSPFTFILTKNVDGSDRYDIDQNIGKRSVMGIRDFLTGLDVDEEYDEYEESDPNNLLDLSEMLEELAVEIVDKINDDFNDWFKQHNNRDCNAVLLLQSASLHGVNGKIHNLFSYEEELINDDKKFYFEFQNMSDDDRRDWYLQSLGIPLAIYDIHSNTKLQHKTKYFTDN